MCVAIVATKGKIIDPANLYEGWRINSDGGGYAYLDDNLNVVINTGFLAYNPFQKAYQQDAERYGKNGPMLIHMRVRSAGDISMENCHPFAIKGGAMIHNGTMFYPSPAKYYKGPRKSDTRVFAEALYNILKLEDIQKAEEGILRAIGRTNKLCFLYNGGQHFIMNEKLGDWKDDIWYSNNSCALPARSDWRAQGKQ